MYIGQAMLSNQEVTSKGRSSNPKVIPGFFILGLVFFGTGLE